MQKRTLLWDDAAPELPAMACTQAGPTWQPALNAFFCEDCIRVCMDLAGLNPADIEVIAEPFRLVVCGFRQAPEPCPPSTKVTRVLALEIDHDPFRRVLNLPAEVDAEFTRVEHDNGMLWVRLPLKPTGALPRKEEPYA